MANCPISTPMLKPNRDSVKNSLVNPKSLKTLAKPKPWNKPKMNAIIQSFILKIGLILWSAANPIENAIIVSTSCDGSVTISNDAKVKVMVCAIVKNDTTLKVGVSASKRNFKKAVDRIRVKRLLREGYRLNKNLLIDNNNDHFTLMILYLSKEMPDFEVINQKMKTLLSKFNDQTSKQ